MKLKALLIPGLIAAVGAALWMRQIASWRPQVVARLGWKMMSMNLSHDGRRMLVGGMVTTPQFDTKTVVLDLENVGNGTRVISAGHPIRDFWKGGAFPLNFRLNPSQKQLIYTPAHGQPVLLEGKIDPQDSEFDARGEGADHFTWFPARREIYHQGNNELRIWDSQTGRLKSRIHNWNGILSPDGLSSLAATLSPKGVNALIRYAVPSGKFAAVVFRSNPPATGMSGIAASDCGWSPDGKFIWFIRREDIMDDYLDFNVVRASDSKKIWSAPCVGLSQWLPDGRIGIMQRDHFSWRDASGREIGRASGPLPGESPPNPFSGAGDWLASPDGKWIYDLDDKGLIRRWRAK